MRRLLMLLLLLLTIVTISVSQDERYIPKLKVDQLRIGSTIVSAGGVSVAADTTALKLLTGSVGSVAYLKELTANSYVGGGLFAMDTVSKYSANGVTAFSSGTNNLVWVRDELYSGKTTAVNVLWAGAYGDSVHVDSLAINRAWTVAVTALPDGRKLNKVYAPKGTYRIRTSVGGGKTWADWSGLQDFEFYGDGMGQTVFILPDSVVFAVASTNFWNFTGDNVYLHDFSIRGPKNINTKATYGVIGIGTHSTRFTLRRLEVTSFSDTSTDAGPILITTYNNNIGSSDESLINTTLGTTTNAGSRWVTPGSMYRIYPGQTLFVTGATQDTVVVDSTNVRQFKATFANNHTSTDIVWMYYYSGWGGHIIDECYLHDSPWSSGIGLATSDTKVQNSKIINVGTQKTTQHTVYSSIGGNIYQGNWIEGTAGFGIQIHNTINAQMPSENRIVNNTIINCRSGFLVTENVVSGDGTNYWVTTGSRNGIMDEITGNVFRVMKNLVDDATVNPPALLIGAPAHISGNTFYNTGATGTNTYGGTDSYVGLVLEGNYFYNLDLAPDQPVIGKSKFAIIKNNTFEMNKGTGAGIYTAYLDTGTVFEGNKIIGTKARGPQIVGSNVKVRNNYIKASTGLDFGYGDSIEISGNTFIGTTNDSYSFNNFSNLSATSVVWVYNNVFLPKSAGGANEWYGIRLESNPSPNWEFWDNRGFMLNQGGSFSTLADGVGKYLWYGDTVASGVTYDRCVTINPAAGVGNGDLILCSTSDTTFFGISPYEHSALQRASYIAGQPGTTYPTLDADAAWTVGHVGILSVTTGGKIHDTGSFIPPNTGKSYVVFLNSGGSAGKAKVKVIKTY